MRDPKFLLKIWNPIAKLHFSRFFYSDFCDKFKLQQNLCYLLEFAEFSPKICYF